MYIERKRTAASLHLHAGMLRFDRYLVTRGRACDLATGQPVWIERAALKGSAAALFTTRAGRTLIDFDLAGRRRVEVWEAWTPPARGHDVAGDSRAFVELLECARLGAPRAYDLPVRTSRHEGCVRRALAREARLHGWVPVALEMLAFWCGASRRGWPPWLADRSLVVFAGTGGLSRAGALALFRLARRDARPHVLVRTALRSQQEWWTHGGRAGPPILHEETEALTSGAPPRDATEDASAESEARARWRMLLPDAPAADRDRDEVALARVLAARGHLFEARALVAAAANDTAAPGTAHRAAVIAEIDRRAAHRMRRGWEMVDDFVDVLQMCQDIEDEGAALARVGAFLHQRLQAASVAFLVREGAAPRVLARVGSHAAGMDLALRTMETGVAVPPPQTCGPAESACPVRHASEVIGALWCRWSAGMPIAPLQASTLLGVAAAAAAPSVRLALVKAQPTAARRDPVPELVGESPAMATVKDAIVRAAASPFPVIIEGESGSGKELAARAIHARSARRDRRFCPLNCAALVEELVEAELFGHVRGAFTGAHADRPGVFEEASGGTLFLDEIAELGARVQAKLLRTLQEGEVRRVGETSVRKVDVRIVAATNRPLAREVAAGTFRADLWYRLDVIRIVLPPLRERLEDLPLIAAHLWQALASRTGSRAVLAPAAMAALAAYDWPGNIRELQNVLASLLVAAPRVGFVGPGGLPAHVARVAALARAATLADARRQFDERYVRAALARAGGRTAHAARDLGVSRQGLVKLMQRLGIAAHAR